MNNLQINIFGYKGQETWLHSFLVMISQPFQSRQFPYNSRILQKMMYYVVRLVKSSSVKSQIISSRVAMPTSNT